MLRTVFSRNIAVLVATVLSGQLLAAMFTTYFVLIPQMDRAAGVLAQAVRATSVALDGVSSERRSSVVARLTDSGQLRLLPASSEPPSEPGRPSLLERRFMQVLSTRLGGDADISWRSDEGGRIWVRTHLGGQPYWLTVETGNSLSPITTLAVAVFVAFLTAALGGAILQRRVDRPLRALVRAAQSFGTGKKPAPFDIAGRGEIRGLAIAFNDMVERLAQNDRDRVLMLAGISHDLRTPLARLRLALSMLPNIDPELEGSAARQIEVMDRMLGQLLAFARGTDGEDLTSTDLRELVSAAVRASEIEVSVTDVHVAGVRVYAYAAALQRAIVNLLENAARYGRFPIAVEAGVEDGMTFVRVIDHGTGIGPEEIDRACQPFTRMPGSPGKGTGLGLAIVQQIALRQSGRLHLKRDVNGRFVAQIEWPVRAQQGR